MTWILVVIVLGTGGQYGDLMVWPGATSVLLNRADPTFRTLGECVATRKALWKKRAQSEYWEVVGARCVGVKAEKPS